MPYNRTRLTPEQRRNQIINAATVQAVERGLYDFSIKNVSSALDNCSKSTVKHYFKTLTLLRNQVISVALHDGVNEALIGQAIAMKDDAVSNLTEIERRHFLQGLV